MPETRPSRLCWPLHRRIDKPFEAEQYACELPTGGDGDSVIGCVLNEQGLSHICAVLGDRECVAHDDSIQKNEIPECERDSIAIDISLRDLLAPDDGIEGRHAKEIVVPEYHEIGDFVR